MDLEFTAPPFPCYMASGEDIYDVGDLHPSRSNLGVFDLLIVTKGALYMGEGIEEWEIAEGHAWIAKPDKYHYCFGPCRTETHFYWIHFQSLSIWSERGEHGWDSHRNPYFKEDEPHADDRLNIKLTKFGTPRFCWLPYPQTLYTLASELVELETQPRAWARWRQQTVFQLLMMELHACGETAQDTTALRIAEQTAEFIRKHYKQDLSYKVIEEELRFHPTYISRCMKKVFGLNVTEYLISYRIDQATLLLINTNLPIGRIAEQVGFANTSYFARKFTMEKGINPSGFRKRYAR
jgi:AraC-like DNA-binding protein